MKQKKGSYVLFFLFDRRERETNRLSQIFLMRVIIIMKQVLHTDKQRRGDPVERRVLPSLAQCALSENASTLNIKHRFV